MLAAWEKMKDREDFIKEELRLFGDSELLEMLANGYHAQISYDDAKGVVRYASESYLPTREDLVKFSHEARRMGYDVTAGSFARKGAAKKRQTLELLISSPKGKGIHVSSLRQPGEESIARTSVEFPYKLSLGWAYLLYRIADLYNMDPLEEIPVGMTPEELKEYFDGYLTEEPDVGTSLRDKPQDISEPFRQFIEGLEF